MAAADSRDSFGTVNYTHKDSAGASVDPDAAPDGTKDNAEGIEAQTAPIPISTNMAIEPTPGTDNARQRSRSPRRHGKEREPFGLTSVHLSHQFGFRDATLWCWKRGGWSAGSRRASRLKDPCGFPSKTGTASPEDTRLKLTRGNLTMFLEPLSTSRSSRIPTTRDTDHKFSPKTTVPRELKLFVCQFAELC